MLGSTVHVPAMPSVEPVDALEPASSVAAGSPLGSVAADEPAPSADWVAVTGGSEASDTGAGPAGRKNRYQSPAAPAMAAARTRTAMTTMAPRVRLGRAVVMRGVLLGFGRCVDSTG